MEPFDLELKNALSSAKPIPAGELTSLNERIVQSFARKQKAVFRLMAIYLAVMTLGILGLLALFMSTSDLKQCLLYGIGILILFEGTVLMKLWYWVMHGKIATVREIKLLHLAVAELRSRSFAAPPGVAPAFQAESAPASARPPAAPAPRKRWWKVLLPVWLLAVAGLAFTFWSQVPDDQPFGTTYFEKTIAAGDAANGAEWQQSFEVAQARQHFCPQVRAAGKNARVWISVNAEGHDPIFSGPVEPRSRIGFGRATPGRYVIKGRTEQAEGALTVRIGGVDQIPGAPPIGFLFFLMLSAAVAVAIPIVWLQGRWLRRIDPELEK